MTRNSTASHIARRVAALAADRKATDVVVLDLADISSVTDAFVICSGRSDVHVRAICDCILEGMAKIGRRPISSEGVEHAHWALLDFGDVVVHVFQPDTRRLYDLERLWNQAPRHSYQANAGTAAGRP